MLQVGQPMPLGQLPPYGGTPNGHSLPGSPRKHLIKYRGNSGLWEVPALNVHAFNFYSLILEVKPSHGTRHGDA